MLQNRLLNVNPSMRPDVKDIIKFIESHDLLNAKSQPATSGTRPQTPQKCGSEIPRKENILTSTESNSVPNPSNIPPASPAPVPPQDSFPQPDGHIVRVRHKRESQHENHIEPSSNSSAVPDRAAESSDSSKNPPTKHQGIENPWSWHDAEEPTPIRIGRKSANSVPFVPAEEYSSETRDEPAPENEREKRLRLRRQQREALMNGNTPIEQPMAFSPRVQDVAVTVQTPTCFVVSTQNISQSKPCEK